MHRRRTGSNAGRIRMIFTDGFGPVDTTGCKVFICD